MKAFFVVVTRADLDDDVCIVRRLSAARAMTSLEVRPLPSGIISRVAADMLGVEELPSELSVFFASSAMGNPAIAHDLVEVLLQRPSFQFRQQIALVADLNVGETFCIC